jgi:hypothetical protein
MKHRLKGGKFINGQYKPAAGHELLVSSSSIPKNFPSGFILMLSSHFLRSFISVMSSKGLLHKFLYVFLVSRILATSSAHRSVFYFAIITMATVWIENSPSDKTEATHY